MEVSIEKSKVMTNSTNTISAVISMNSQKLGEVPGSDPVQRWHLLSRNPHQDCLSSGSYGQVKLDVAEQHYQLHKKV